MITKAFGTSGEIIAINYLKKLKYKIIEINYRCLIGEIDIICQDKHAIVFVEVKKRTTDKFGLPREAVTPYKQNKIKQVAQMYLKINNLFKKEIRFDVIEILDEKINHLIACFD